MSIKAKQRATCIACWIVGGIAFVSFGVLNLILWRWFIRWCAQ